MHKGGRGPAWVFMFSRNNCRVWGVAFDSYECAVYALSKSMGFGFNMQVVDVDGCDEPEADATLKPLVEDR